MHLHTQLISAGRHPQRFSGMVNTPVFRGSTLLSGSLAEWEERRRRQLADEPGAAAYGRFGTPTHEALQEAMAQLEGGHRSLLFPSGLAACAGALIGLLTAGDHVLITASAYSPTLTFLQRVLARFGVEVSTYSPTIAGGIEAELRHNTRVVYVESPGSDTFEVQDVPAIAAAAHRHGAYVVMDNSWATPLLFKPLAHGVDVSVQAATKYIVGHSDALLGIVTCTRDTWPLVRGAAHDMGQTAGPDDVFLALRGLRTLAVRLRQHEQSAYAVASWLERHPAVDRVFYPALPSHPQHALWKRDYSGASGLFAVVLQPMPHACLAQVVDSLHHFGIGLSWGGYESLVVPVDPRAHRSRADWPHQGPVLRLHIGLEDPADLIAELAQALDKAVCETAG